MKKLKVIVIGAGIRGIEYTEHMANNPDMYQVVAVAEPVASRRNYMKEKHNIPEDMCFEDWHPLLALGKIADVALIATMDRDHFEPTIKAIDLKYDILLEKPIAPEAKECKAIQEAAEKNDIKVVICTVLRYTEIFTTLKDIIDSGKIGDVMSINHEECVGYIHQSHSFVRGNWGNSERSSTMLLQKSCHDVDILQWLLGKRCKQVQSFGKLTYFTEANAPDGAPDYCIQGCPVQDTCPFNAVKLYLDDKDNDWFRSSCSKEYKPTDEIIKNSITNTQYGKCVFKCDNDVVDHQTVNMLFEDDVLVTFTMNPFNKGGRHIHIMGTKGEIRAAIDGNSPINVRNLVTDEIEVIPLVALDGINGGHGGGDGGIVKALYSYITGTYTGKSIPEISESCYNHLVTFAIEESRKTNKIVDVEEFIKNL